MKRRIKNAFIILMSSVVLGILLLVMVYCLPVKLAREHVKESIYPMIDVKYSDIPDPKRMKILELKENFTDYLMVQNTLEKVTDKNIIEHAMYVYHHDLGNDTTWMTEESLAAFVNTGTQGMFLREYSKYWHGYLIWLKPLLMCMSWESAESFWVILQIVFLLLVVGISIYRKQGVLGLGVAITLFFMKPLRIWISFAMCVCWGIILWAILGLLLYYHKIEKQKWQEEFFLLIGVLTAYMDFLTYPIATIGIPLCAYLYMNMEQDMKCLQRIRKVFWLGMMWVVGYIGMWGMKWVSAEIFCQSGTLRNAVWSVIYRTSPLDGYVSAFSGVSRTIKLVLSQYDSVVYSVGFWAIAVLAIISATMCLIKARNRNWAITVICLIIIGLLPFAWIVLTQNHTAIHCWFTFRIMGVSVFSLWCIMLCSFKTMKRKNKGHEI